MNIEEIQRELDSYSEALCSEEVLTPDQKCDKLSQLSIILARVNDILPTLKKVVRNKKKDFLQNTPENFYNLSAKLQNELYNLNCTDELFCYETAEGLYKTCVHQISALRTLISKEKEEYKQSNY